MRTIKRRLEGTKKAEACALAERTACLRILCALLAEGHDPGWKTAELFSQECQDKFNYDSGQKSASLGCHLH